MFLPSGSCIGTKGQLRLLSFPPRPKEAPQGRLRRTWPGLAPCATPPSAALLRPKVSDNPPTGSSQGISDTTLKYHHTGGSTGAAVSGTTAGSAVSSSTGSGSRSPRSARLAEWGPSQLPPNAPAPCSSRCGARDRASNALLIASGVGAASRAVSRIAGARSNEGSFTKAD